MSVRRPLRVFAVAAASASGWLTSARSQRFVAAAVFAGAVAFMGAAPPAFADHVFIDVRKGPVQQDGDVIDKDPTTGHSGSLTGNPTTGMLNKDRIDDWGALDADTDLCDDPGSPLDIVAPTVGKTAAWDGNIIPEDLPLDSCGWITGPTTDNSDDADGHTFGESVSRVHIIDVDKHNWKVSAGRGQAPDDSFSGTKAIDDICNWRGVYSSVNIKSDLQRVSGALHVVTNTDPDTDGLGQDPSDTFDPDDHTGNIGSRDETFLSFLAYVRGFNGDNTTAFWYLQKDIAAIPLQSSVAGGDIIFRPPGFDPDNFECVDDISPRPHFAGTCSAPDPCFDATNPPDFQLHDDDDLFLEIDFLKGGGEVVARASVWDTSENGGAGGLVEIVGPGTGVAESNCGVVLTEPGTGDPRLCATSNADIFAARAKDAPLDTKSISTWLNQHPKTGGNEPPTRNGELGIGEPTLGGCEYPGMWPNDDQDCRMSADPIEPWWHGGATLFEGGINLSAFFDPIPCFITFLGQTITSGPNTAEGMDYALGTMRLCGDIKVIKETIPSGANGAFPFDAKDNDGNFLIDDMDTKVDDLMLGDMEMFQVIDLLPGIYTAAENTVPLGWDLTDITCEETGDGDTIDDVPPSIGPGQVGTATIKLQIAESVTCTFTNTQRGKIIIDKVTVPSGDSQVFNFTLTGGPSTLNQSFGLADATTPHDSGFVIPGNGYFATETVPTGWDLTNTVCDDNAATGTGVSPSTIGNIDVSPGETVTCTYTNTKRGKIIIDKVTVPSGDLQMFDFTLKGGPSTLDQSFGLADATTPHDSGFVIPGTGYVAAEAVQIGWDLTNTVCDDNAATGTGITPSTIGNIHVSPGETVTCTYTNTKRGSIKIIKNTVGGDATFTYADSLVTAGFGPTLTTDNGTKMQTVDNLVPGSFVVTESNPMANPGGWDFTSLTCSDPDNGTTISGRSATIDLDPGELVTCTYTNTKRGKIIIEKQTDPDVDPQTFVFAGDVSGTLGDGQTAMQEVVPGQYTSTETLPAPTNDAIWGLTAITCDDGNSNGDVSSQTATFNVEAGETVKCTFFNRKTLPAPGIIQIIKQSNGGTEVFSYSTTGGSNLLPAFTLDTAVNNPTVPSTPTTGRFINMQTNLLGPTEYTVLETLPLPGAFSFVSLSCVDSVDSGTASTTSGMLATIQLDDGETVTCTYTNEAPTNVCEFGKPAEITMRYTGKGGDNEDHNQEGDEVIIIGDAGFANPVHITVFDHKGKEIAKEVVYLGGTFYFTGFNGKVPPRTLFEIRADEADVTPLETVQFHTSCSEPLEVGDEFGSLEVVSFAN